MDILDKIINILFYVPLIVLGFWLVGFVLYKLGIYKPQVSQAEQSKSKIVKLFLFLGVLLVLSFTGFYKFSCDDSCRQSVHSFFN